MPDAGFFTVRGVTSVKAGVARVCRLCKETLHSAGFFTLSPGMRDSVRQQWNRCLCGERRDAGEIQGRFKDSSASRHDVYLGPDLDPAGQRQAVRVGHDEAATRHPPADPLRVVVAVYPIDGPFPRPV